MTLREFQYCVTGYCERKKEEARSRAQLAIMIGRTVRSKKLMKNVNELIRIDTPRQTGLFNKKHRDLPESALKSKKGPMPELMQRENIKTREDLKKYHEAIIADFKRISDSPKRKEKTLDPGGWS